ncbi:MAG: response regulator, partial [Terriglobia bacterium]
PLASESRLFEALMDNIPDTIYFKDRHSRLIQINKALLKKFGFHDSSEAIGKTALDLEVNAERAQAMIADDQEVIRTGLPLIDREQRETWPGRPDTWASVTKAPFFDAEGRIAGIVGISRNITARKRAEEELRQAREDLQARVNAQTAELLAKNAALEQEIAERRHAEEAALHEKSLVSAIMENIPDAVYFKNMQGKYTRVNQGFIRKYGLSGPSEAIGKTVFDFFTGEYSQYAHDTEQEVMRTGQPLIGMESEQTWPDRPATWASVTKIPVYDQEGNVAGLFGLARDITARKLAEAELRRAKEAADAANRAKSEFLANMSHEIRTPMNGILGMTELALETNLTGEQREYLDLVKASTQSLLAVINDVLDFSKIEANKLDIDPIEFKLRDSLAETMKSIAHQAHAKSLEIACDVDPAVPEDVVGDPVRLRQIMVNLLSNAIKFTSAGEVVVQVNLESEAGPEAVAHFRVSDTGIGIPKEKQEVIFGAFAQADASMTRKYGGTGLGLAICSRLVQLMGGRIWVESEAGSGSSFHFTTTFGRPKTAITHLAAAGEELLLGLRALVVDDNATNRRILGEILTRWGAKPSLASDARTALAMLLHASNEAVPFEVVLTDAHMPDMDGFTLAEKIQEHPQLTGATIMMLTSGGQRGDAARCRRLGIAAYLTKPVAQSELRDAILKVLGCSPQAGSVPLVTRHSLRETRSNLNENHEPSGLRILLAEDNAVNQTLATRLLEKMGNQVVVAANGLEALAAIEKQAFDLVLMDVQMPEMDGLEAVSVLRQHEKNQARRLPVIAMTAHAMKGDRERCLEAGMDAYVSKPIVRRALVETINSVLSSEGVLNEREGG